MKDRCSTTWANARRQIGDHAAEGQSMVEYSLIFVLMIVVCLSILGTLSDNIYDNFFVVVGAMP